MVRFIHECVGCSSMGFPCMGHSCTQGYMEVICDWCDEEVDQLYVLDGDEVCEDCLLATLDQDEEEDWDEVLYNVDGEWLDRIDALWKFKRVLDV